MLLFKGYNAIGSGPLPVAENGLGDVVGGGAVPVEVLPGVPKSPLVG